MTDQTIQHPTKSTAGTAKIVYILNFVGLVFPLISIISVIVAYMADKNDPVSASHLKFQIRTFWWSFLMGLVGLMTIFFVVGGFILLWVMIYIAVRNITGFMLLKENLPVTGTKTVALVAV